MTQVRISVIYTDPKKDPGKLICSTTKSDIGGYNTEHVLFDEMAYTIAIELAKSHAGHGDIVYVSHRHYVEDDDVPNIG